MNILGCDNREDAINSLSLIYEVDRNKIISSLHTSFDKHIKEVNYELNKDCLPLICRSFLETEIFNINYEAKFYHRTIYNYDREWFQEGLLGSTEGVLNIIESLSPYVAKKELEEVKERSINIVNERKNKNDPDHGGSYFFDIFDLAATKSSTLMDYSIPESINWTIKKSANPEIKKIEKIIREKYKQIVIVIKHNNYDEYSYITNLWKYAHMMEHYENFNPDDKWIFSLKTGARKIDRANILKILEI